MAVSQGWSAWHARRFDEVRQKSSQTSGICQQSL
jgi:hypothetical protein